MYGMCNVLNCAVAPNKTCPKGLKGESVPLLASNLVGDWGAEMSCSKTVSEELLSYSQNLNDVLAFCSVFATLQRPLRGEHKGSILSP